MRSAWSARFFAVGKPYRARFDYPGVVSALDRNTGELIAKSLPGRAAELEGPRSPPISTALQPGTDAPAETEAAAS